MFNKIINKVNELEPALIEIRRYLHKNPELSGQEFNTSAFIHKKLVEAGIESEIIQTEAGPAVIGQISKKENADKNIIAFRADMDALPVVDKKKKEYCSKFCGVMHACGHDFHSTSLLGLALTLASIKQELDVNIKFIFQPSEEVSRSGAKALVKTGIMEGVKAIWTIHSHPGLETGKVGILCGPITASIDTFKITINGIGGHSSCPHLTVDSIFISNQVLNCIYSDIPRNIDPIEPVVISVCKIHGGTASNIISSECELEGTVRTLNPDVRLELKKIMETKIAAISNQYESSSIDLEWMGEHSSVINDPILTKVAENSAIKLLGIENIDNMESPSMGAEDFSRYLSSTPGMLIRIGTGGKDSSYPLHSCLFDINEKAIRIAVCLLSLITIDFQKNICNIRDYVNDFAAKS